MSKTGEVGRSTKRREEDTTWCWKRGRGERRVEEKAVQKRLDKGSEGGRRRAKEGVEGWRKREKIRKKGGGKIEHAG